LGKVNVTIDAARHRQGPAGVEDLGSVLEFLRYRDDLAAADTDVGAHRVSCSDDSSASDNDVEFTHCCSFFPLGLSAAATAPRLSNSGGKHLAMPCV
jgi:hypothetical protein